jgi:hypothetical protein
MSLHVGHNAGFFSCCSVKLYLITEYLNKHKKYPEIIKSSLFSMYNPNNKEDITYDFFEKPIDVYHTPINYIDYHHSHQFKEYRKLDFENILPVVKRYFEPSPRIKMIASQFVKTYNINCDNCVALYYRGTDKVTETLIDSFDRFYDKLNEVIKACPRDNIQVLIQSDSAQFLDYIKSKSIKNIIIIPDVTPSYTNVGSHIEKNKECNFNDITNLNSIIYIMSKCKSIICTSGNVSIWTIFFRGNADHVYQNYNCNWV